MKWFKHQTDMIDDPKMRRLVKKHGAEAYAVYNLVIERIVRRLDKESPIPDLEETGEDIADMLRMDTVKVQEIMWTGIEQGLFEQDEITGRIVANKVYKFILKSETRSAEIRKMIETYKENGTFQRRPELSQTVTDKPRLSETNVIDKDRDKDKDERETRALGEIVKMPEHLYQNLVDDYGETTVRDYAERVDLYCRSKGKRYKDYSATIRQWLRKDGVEKQRKTAPIDESYIPELDDPDYAKKSKERLLEEIGAK